MIAKKYQKRILRLADFMEKLPPKRFNFEDWVGNDWKGATDLSCGTTACALGWASTLPYFQKLGLHPMRKNTDPLSWDAVKFGRQLPFDAGETVFGLGAIQFRELFTPLGARMFAKRVILTPKQWAKHARRFVKKNS